MALPASFINAKLNTIIPMMSEKEDSYTINSLGLFMKFVADGIHLYLCGLISFICLGKKTSFAISIAHYVLWDFAK